MPNEWIEELKAQLEDHDNVVVLNVDQAGETMEMFITSVSYDSTRNSIVIEVVNET